MSRELSLIDRAVKTLRPKVGRPEVAVVLGSGMSRVLPLPGRGVPYTKVPGFPRPSIKGHAGVLSAGTVRKRKVVVLRGRAHLYEGRSPAEVVRPVRVMARLGVKVLIITNAAGAVNARFRPGDLMVIRDHLNMTGANPLEGDNIEKLGTRFPDLSKAYDRKLGDRARTWIGKNARQGVYAALRGPSYETPAEVRMLRRLGADATGMSTVPEVIAASHAGMRVVGISCITNMAAGLAKQELNHQEVVEVSARVESRMAKVLEGLLGDIR